LRIVTTVYHHLGKILVKEKGTTAKNLGDEGGYAPPLKDPSQVRSSFPYFLSSFLFSFVRFVVCG
jgi:enolase